MAEPANNHSQKAGRRAFLLAALAIAAFALLMFRKVFAGDSWLFTTDDNIGLCNLLKGTMPRSFLGWWNDAVFLGMPGGVMPLTLNNLFLWLAPIKLYINSMHGLCLAGASLFLMLFFRERKVSYPAVFLAPLTAFWLGSNFTLTYAGHNGKFAVLFMFSASLYCVSRALSERPKLSWSVLAGGAMGLMFLEQLDVALFFAIFLGAYALFLAIRRFRVDGTALKPALALVLMAAIALMLSAHMIISGYVINVKGAAAMQTESPREKWEYVTQWSWPPEESIDFIAPGYMGWRSGEPAGPYWGRMGRSAGWETTRQGFMNFKLENTYLGIIPVLFAVFAVLSAVMAGKTASPQMTQMAADWPLRRAEILLWGCAALIALLLAFGKFFPLYSLFYRLPLVSSIRNPNKFLQVFQLALGILAAYGMEGMMLRGKRVERGAESVDR